jgi:hypothetical protein
VRRTFALVAAVLVLTVAAASATLLARLPLRGGPCGTGRARRTGGSFGARTGRAACRGLTRSGSCRLGRLGGAARRAARRTRSFRPRFDSRQGDASPLLIDVHHPHIEQVADADHFVRIANESIGQPADVNQSAVHNPDIDKGAEVDHV